MKNLEKTILVIGLVKCSVCFHGTFLNGLATSRQMVWSLVTLALIVLIAYRSFQDREMYLPSPSIFIAMFGFFTMAAISVYFAINKPESIYQLSKIFNMICYLLAASVVLKDDKDFIVKLSILTGFGLAVYGVYQYANTTDMMDRKGTMGFKNLWASAHLLLLPMCLYSITKLQKWWKVLGSITAILLLVNIFLPPVTRSVVLALIVAGIAVSFFKPKIAITTYSIIGISVFGIYWFRDSSCIQYVVNLPHVKYLANSFYFKLLISGSSMNERTLIWSSVIRMIRDNPYGVGIGNWIINSPLYLNGANGVGWAYTRLYPSRPHNEFLGAIAETGLIGGALFISIFATALYCAWRKRNAVVFIATIFFGVYAFFSFPSERVFHPMILMIYFAMLINYKRVQVSRAWIVTISFLLISGMSFVTFDYYKQHESNTYISRIVYRRTVGDWKGVLADLDNSSWFSQLGPLATPIENFRGEAYLALNDPNQAIQGYKAALKIHPYHFVSYNNLGGLYDMKGEPGKAAVVFKEILELWPDNEKIKANLEMVEDKQKLARMADAWLQNESK